jgi:hypothetical protein
VAAAAAGAGAEGAERTGAEGAGAAGTGVERGIFKERMGYFPKDFLRGSNRFLGSVL